MWIEMFETSMGFNWWVPTVMIVGVLLVVGVWRWAAVTSRHEAAEVK